MRKLIAILAGTVACSCLSLALAADPEASDAMTITSVSGGTYTQAVDSVTKTIAYDGWLEGIWVTFTGGVDVPTVTASVSVVAIHPDPGIYDFTILPATVQILTSKWYAVRSPVQNQAGAAISNEGGKLPLQGNKFVFKAYSANSTNAASINATPSTRNA